MKIRTLHNVDGRYHGIKELRQYLNVGRDTAKRIAREAGAEIRIGSRVLYDREKIDEYMESLTNSQVEEIAEKE